MNKKLLALVSLILLLFSNSSFANSNSVNEEVKKYLDTYYPMAIREMKRYKIPASITLAQSIIESGWGKSELARKSNNHFGIKCRNDWEGERVLHDDDAQNECFRKYDDVNDSYVDHSLFLVNNARYRSLFHLGLTDYKGWANGLKKAGYATSPIYAKKLIELIEKYHLYRYDAPELYGINPKGNYRVERASKITKVYSASSAQMNRYVSSLRDRKVYEVNGSKYVVVKRGDTWRKVSFVVGKTIRRLHKMNSINDADEKLREGDRIYITKMKRKTGMNGQRYTVTKVGETLFDISQKYAIRLSELCEENNLMRDQKMPIGRVITLR